MEGYVLENHIYYLKENDSNNMYSISLILDEKYNVKEVYNLKADEDSFLSWKFENMIQALKLIKETNFNKK